MWVYFYMLLLRDKEADTDKYIVSLRAPVGHNGKPILPQTKPSYLPRPWCSSEDTLLIEQRVEGSISAVSAGES